MMTEEYKYRIEEEEAALRLLQTYLLEISYATDGMPHIAIDGVPGEETTEAIRLFQERNNLPVTGVADYETWEEIYRHYVVAKEARTAVPTLLSPAALPMTRRSAGSEVFLLQVLLGTMCDRYPTLPYVPFNGRMDAETQYAVRRYQVQQGLPGTGIVDLTTWERLADEYQRTEMGKNGER